MGEVVEVWRALKVEYLHGFNTYTKRVQFSATMNRRVPVSSSASQSLHPIGA